MSLAAFLRSLSRGSCVLRRFRICFVMVPGTLRHSQGYAQQTFNATTATCPFSVWVLHLFASPTLKPKMAAIHTRGFPKQIFKDFAMGLLYLYLIEFGGRSIDLLESLIVLDCVGCSLKGSIIITHWGIGMPFTSLLKYVWPVILDIV